MALKNETFEDGTAKRPALPADAAVTRNDWSAVPDPGNQTTITNPSTTTRAHAAVGRVCADRIRRALRCRP